MHISEFRCYEFSVHKIYTEATINIIKEKQVRAGRSGVRIRAWTKYFVFSKKPTTSLGPTQAPIQ
jgi:hypothetical protein